VEALQLERQAHVRQHVLTEEREVEAAKQEARLETIDQELVLQLLDQTRVVKTRSTIALEAAEQSQAEVLQEEADIRAADLHRAEDILLVDQALEEVVLHHQEVAADHLRQDQALAAGLHREAQVADHRGEAADKNVKSK